MDGVALVTALNKPIEKLIETIGNGIGKLYEPAHIVRMAKAKASEIDIISTSLTNNFTFPIQYTNNNITIDNSDADELLKRAGLRTGLQELTRQINIDSVVKKAYVHLEQEESVSDEKVNQDWTFRFFRSVEDVSDDQMQELWAKILAGEIKQPNTYSLRTLELLKSISLTEAQVFEKTCQFSFVIGDSRIIPSYQEINEKYGLPYSSLLSLEECGLISSTPFKHKGYTINSHAKEEIIIYNNRIALLSTNNTEEDHIIRVEMYNFTKAGYELANLINTQCNLEYGIDISKQIRQSNPLLIFSARPVVEFSIDKIKLDDADLLAES